MRWMTVSAILVVLLFQGCGGSHGEKQRHALLLATESGDVQGQRFEEDVLMILAQARTTHNLAAADLPIFRYRTGIERERLYCEKRFGLSKEKLPGASLVQYACRSDGRIKFGKAGEFHSLRNPFEGCAALFRQVEAENIAPKSSEWIAPLSLTFNPAGRDFHFNGRKLASPRFDVKVNIEKSEYVFGEPVRVSVTASRDCYVYLYTVNSKGKDTILCPNADYPDNHVAAGEVKYIRDTKGRPPYQESTEGRETLHAFAAAAPLDAAKLNRRFNPKTGDINDLTTFEAAMAKEIQQRLRSGPHDAQGLYGYSETAYRVLP